LRVPLVAAAVCPHPPALVPGVAPAFDAELADLRAACVSAVAALAAPALVVVGTGTATGRLAPPYGGSFAAWGSPVAVGAGGTGLPLSLLVGAWLVSGRSGVRMLAVAADAAPAECAALGAEIAGAAGPVALLAMGDGTAMRGEKAPGYADPRAEAFDASVAGALAAGDPRVLAGLDPTLAAELLVAGRAPWQVLAGAALATRPRWHGELHYADAPYGVGYFAASWS
jgi:hypothetical protein